MEEPSSEGGTEPAQASMETTLTDPGAPSSPVAEGPVPPRVVVGAAFLLTLAGFWPTLLSFHPVWTTYIYSHGYIVGLMTLWLVWRHGRGLTASHVGSPQALLPLVALSLLWLVVMILNVQVVQQAALPILFAAWGLTIFGMGAVGVVLPIAATFLLAVPFWEVLIPPLQLLTIVVNEALLWVVRIPADVQGELITISAGTFEVAEGCAGLSKFKAAMVTGVLYAHLFVRGWRTRLAILALAVATALLSNWIRVFGLIVIGHATDMQSSLMTAHDTYGWSIFTIALVPFFFFAHRIEQRGSRRDGSPEERVVASAPHPNTDSDDTHDAAPSGLWTSRASLLERTALASAVALIGPLIYFAYGALPAVEASGFTVSSLTDEGSPWRLIVPHVERPFLWQPRFSGAAEHQTAALTDGDARVYFDHLTYREQVQGAELIMGGNRITRRRDVLQERVNGPVDSNGRFVREAVLQTEDGPILVWYWYRVAGVDTSSRAMAKLLELVSFVRRYPEAELVAFSAACAADSCLNAFEALVTLFGAEVGS